MRTRAEQEILDDLISRLGRAAVELQELIIVYVRVRLDVTGPEKDLIILALLNLVRRFIIEVKGVRRYSQLTQCKNQ